MVVVASGVDISVRLFSGSRRSDRLASLEAAPFVGHDSQGKAARITRQEFESLSEEAIRDAFSGPGSQFESWAREGAGADQRLVITLSFDVTQVAAYCDRKERCINGEWVPVDEWRPRVETRSVSKGGESATIAGNLEAGFGRGEEDVLAEILALFAKVKAQIRRVPHSDEDLAYYQIDCRSDRRA